MHEMFISLAVSLKSHTQKNKAFPARHLLQPRTGLEARFYGYYLSGARTGPGEGIIYGEQRLLLSHEHICAFPQLAPVPKPSRFSCA
jgi:hypothetical protein